MSPVPNNRVQRSYIIARYMFGVFQVIEKRDTLKLINLYNSIFTVLTIMKKLNPDKDRELIDKAKEIWTGYSKVSEYKIKGPALYIMLEYLSSLLSMKDHKDYLSIGNYIETTVDIPTNEKVELNKIAVYLNDELYKLFNIKSPTELLKKSQVKNKKQRDVSKKKVKVKKKKNFNSFVKKKKRKKEFIKQLVANTRISKATNEKGGQYDIEKGTN